MPRKSHPDVVATLDFLAHVATAYAFVVDDAAHKTATPATTWWYLPDICKAIPAVQEPRWILWVHDLQNGIWPAAPDSDLAEICMAIRSFPGGTLIQNFKQLCDARGANKSITALPKKAVFHDYRLDAHYLHRADQQLQYLLSDENRLLLHTAIARSAPWHTQWLEARTVISPQLTQTELTETLPG